MKKKLLQVLCILLCTLFMQNVFAQNSRTVTGRVISSDDKLGVPAVSVMVKGTSTGTQTDLNGNYKITVPGSNSVLVFTSIGFDQQERIVGNATSIDVTMNSQGTNLDEVVVIGYGETTRRDVTGSVSSVKMPDLQKAPVRSFEEALAGRVAGVTASADDGQPGANVSIVIRGNNSLTQDNSPLYVIDGFPVENPDNNALNPQEIESIDILKDASSTAIYGARGANGVVVITTKKGKEGKPVINYNGYYGFMSNTRQMELMDGYEFVKLQQERDPANAATLYLDSVGYTLEDYRNIKPISLQDSLFGNVPFMNHSISLSGGSKGTRYSISGSILDQDGIITNSGYNRYQGRFTIDQVVNDKFKVSLNTSYSNMKQFGTSPSTGGNGFFYGNLLYSVWAFRPVSAAMLQVDQIDLEENEDEFIALGGFNPIKTAENEIREGYTNVFISNISGDYEFGKYLKLRITGGITNNRRRNIDFNGPLTPRGSPLTVTGITNGVNGEILVSESTTWLNENTLTFNRRFNTKHHLNVLGGITAQGNKRTASGGQVNLIPNEALIESGFDEGTPVSIRATSGEYKLASFLGRVNYTLNGKYMLTASMRADGSSKFTKDERWGYFPSGALAWRLSDESFMKPLKFLSNVKIRASYGATGNNRVDDFAPYSRLSIPGARGYALDGVTPTKIAILSELGNPVLKWETTTQTDLGLELGFFNQRISLEADVYRKVTEDLLLDASIPGSLGFTTAIMNIGKVQNQGIEFNLSTINVKGKNLGWTSNFNISFNRNKVLALSNGETFRTTNAPWNTQTTQNQLYIAEIGEPIARFYGFEWLGNYQLEDFNENTPGVYTLKPDVPSYSLTGGVQPGYIKYRDVNEDGVVNAEDAGVIGDPNPDYTGGFSNNFNYKNFDLNLFLQFSVGGDLINANRIIFEGGARANQNMFATYENRWTFENQNNEHFREGGQGPQSMFYSTRVIEDGSYLKLKTVSFGYSLPKQLLDRAGISNARLYVSGQNLFTWTKYQGFDPEVSKFGSSALRPGFDYSVYPHARTVTFGLNVSL